MTVLAYDYPLFGVSYVQDAASSGGAGTADELAKLADLKPQGVITDAEFAQEKAKLLA